ncbi:hypothetical protein VNO80_15631 [Phaseolus coccineus]|uniref:Uncharacterized protein n=1 Tax=Phaseolus coccineus TaxID=3886 RepID=A0AAN9R2G8_PHACN
MDVARPCVDFEWILIRIILKRVLLRGLHGGEDLAEKICCLGLKILDGALRCSLAEDVLRHRMIFSHALC